MEAVAMVLSFLSTCSVFIFDPTKSIILEFGTMRVFLVYAFLPLFYIIWEGVITLISRITLGSVKT